MSDSTKRRGPKGGRERFQLVIPTEVMDQVRELSSSENRSLSNMLATLVSEAIKTRKEKNESGPFEPAGLEQLVATA